MMMSGFDEKKNIKSPVLRATAHAKCGERRTPFFMKFELVGGSTSRLTCP